MEMFKQQSVTKTPDLLGYLVTRYLEANPGADTEYDEGHRFVAVELFIEWCRNHMRENQAIALDYLSQGMGIRLQDGTVVEWVELPPAPDGLPSVGAGIPISQPKTASFKQGVVPTHSFPVTKPK